MDQFVNAIGTMDFTTLPASLQGIAVSKGILLPTYMFDAMAEILQGIDVIENDGKTPLYTWEFMDQIKKAEDAFVANKIAKLKARIPTIEDYEIDTEISRSELISIGRSYQKWMMGIESLDEALKADFALFFLQKAMKEMIVQKIALKAVWKGNRTVTQSDRGAEKSFTGLIKRISDGYAVGGDIPADNVFESEEALDEDNAYDEVNAVCQKAYNTVELTGLPINVYLSEQVWLNYCKKRRAMSPNTIKLGETTDKPDYMPNLTFKPQHGLAGKETVVVTPKTNLKFSVNDNPGNYNLEMAKVMKGYQLNILASGGVDYGYGAYLFCNDKV